jgi:SHS2 domain-containing protein
MTRYETIEHTADTGIRAFGATEVEAFENAAAGMFSIIADPREVEERDRFTIYVEAEDRETLLVEWLNELLYLLDSKGLLLKRFQITELSDTRLSGTVWGEAIDPSRHQLRLEIKAVTYHQLRVIQTADGWMAEVIFDV